MAPFLVLDPNLLLVYSLLDSNAQGHSIPGGFARAIQVSKRTTHSAKAQAETPAVAPTLPTTRYPFVHTQYVCIPTAQVYSYFFMASDRRIFKPTTHPPGTLATWVEKGHPRLRPMSLHVEISIVLPILLY
ncbi:hypothetical protein F4778DRAFT_748115 [Xylariomycetidae sp. FL2044]|nr:hypothetical protein F4778DRAFT_748115 [Xylariomycetidae sp. FL2044]